MIRPSQSIEFTNAYFIKLGAGGEWETDSINNAILRLGWPKTPLADIHAGRWDNIRTQLAEEHPNKPNTITTDLNGLKIISLSTPNDLWITFHQSKMWWGRIANSPIEEDGISKFRRLNDQWQSVDLQGHSLQTVNLPGALSRVQGYRGTVCRVLEKDTLYRVLNALPGSRYQNLVVAQQALTEAASDAIRELHWKDFETLVDLVFACAGWRRVSVAGEVMKYADLILEEPITRDRYVVQIKSSASLADFERYASQFRGMDFRRLYFVVHSPTSELERATNAWEDVELLTASTLASKVVEAGLVRWLLDKVR